MDNDDRHQPPHHMDEPVLDRGRQLMLFGVSFLTTLPWSEPGVLQRILAGRSPDDSGWSISRRRSHSS